MYSCSGQAAPAAALLLLCCCCSSGYVDAVLQQALVKHRVTAVA
jgi:hypothetical protein